MTNHEVEVWISSELDPGRSRWFEGPHAPDFALSPQPKLELTPPSPSTASTIIVKPDHTYQQMLGIGTSLEETTIHNLSKMDADQRAAIIRQLTDRENGIGFNLFRLTIGTSDFTAEPFYTYNDLEEGETDFEMKRFSIQKDIDLNIIATVQELQKGSPDTVFFASPWSPPAWMKTNGSLKRGSLKEGAEYTEALARYYRMAIQAYEQQGIPIYAMTLQNEPLLEIDYPSCYMSPARQKELAAALRREFEAHGMKTKLWIFDHNFHDAWDYIAPILNDEEGRTVVDGLALHDYEGSPAIMSELHAAYPDKPIYLTERALWGTAGADRMAQYFRNYACSYNSWVTMLDSEIGTHQWVGTPGPTMFVQDAVEPNRYWKTPEYDLLAQYARFVQPGAYRIESTYGSTDTVTNVAFRNPDGSLAAVVINQTDSEQPFRVLCEGKQFAAVLPARAVGTYVWRG
ncbi:glucosylceramidase [Paenibacillus cellulosilyticus]|uniref:Glucosylceramidase n=1 Tax=Paenibacillus cellulosilyticus TaxID=375489 RepID=A0A2V2YNF2_9BACL|nr:glycoside hydrolase family 30 beta sandwich domain-containing protein [Paenibacillus cellulosilyticus]PWV90623.1 glucosylceramidase [Paenibacillus cellulosilyticus]QKS43954.1 glycosyl hydrolase [Paenibacillus cellulosilyticus]